MGVQELDIIPLIKTVTNYAISVKRKEDISKTFETAFEKCVSGRMGPVWVEVPFDIQNQSIEVESINAAQVEVKFESSSSVGLSPSESIIDYEFILNKIASAKRPLFVIGHGIWLSKTEKLFVEILEKTKIPLVASWLGKDIVDNNSPLYFGSIGILGERCANFAIQKSDLLIVLGCRLTITQIGYNTKGFSNYSYKIMVDIDQNEIDKKILSIDLKIYPTNQSDSHGRTVMNYHLHHTCR